MATVVSCKQAKGFKAGPPAKKAKPGDPAGNFVLDTTEDGGVMIWGTDGTLDAAGNPTQVDISAVATLTVTSSDPSIVGITGLSGMSFKESGLAIGHADVTITATWNDGKTGPFVILDPIDVVAPPPPPPAPVTGLLIVHGPPTIRTGP